LFSEEHLGCPSTSSPDDGGDEEETKRRRGLFPSRRANVINKSPEHAGLFARTRPLTLFDSAAGSLALKRARQDEIAGAGASTIKQQMTEKKPQAGEGRLA